VTKRNPARRQTRRTRRDRNGEEAPTLGERLVASRNEGWQLAAACRGADASLFFAPNYFERREEKDGREAKAKAICARCSVRRPCLEYALETREPHGVWGGLNEFERRQVLRRNALLAG
jgi:WhiB family transcriptional regulator, redox-sensing transcriptional regulator